VDPDGYATLTAVALAGLVRDRQVSAREAVEAALLRIDALDDRLCAFRSVWRDDARRAADEVDRAVRDGVQLPLAGVPIGVKEWDGLRSAQARALVDAGCVPVGSTSVPRTTVDWQTWGHTDRGPTRNPWRPDRVPGGSSAGSAVAVAAGMVPLATGTDGAGSIRIPAAWCGVVGVKVTGAAGRDGLRTVGPLARTVADATAYLQIVLGTTFPAALGGTAPLRAAWSATLGLADTDPEVVAVAHTAAARLAHGGVIEWAPADVELVDPEQAWRAARDGTAGGPHPVRLENDQRLAELFDDVDLLLTPTTPGPPHGNDGPGERMNVSLTWAFNVSGHPALSVPAGLLADGTPVGLQLVSPHHGEHVLLHVAAALERLAPWPVGSPARDGRPSGAA
jgi:Asp-tRNA(Asn)/Glu-tRNA(Gln) amidotransferase A subunit family amidase